MTYCTQCGRKVTIHIHPGRNPRSYHHGKPKGLKDHDLCRQCFKSMMNSARALGIGNGTRP